MSVTAVPIRPLARGTVLKLWIGLLVLCLAGAALAWFGTGPLQREVTESGLQFRIVEEGEGEPITRADLVALRYKLRLGGPGGELLQDSDQTGQPAVLTADSVVPGFGEGLLKMRQGGTYQLWIPPQLGYGDRVPPGAPFGPDDTLFFEINILQVERGMAALQQLMGAQGAQSGGGPQGGGASPPPEGGSGGGAQATPPPGGSSGNSQ